MYMKYISILASGVIFAFKSCYWSTTISNSGGLCCRCNMVPSIMASEIANFCHRLTFGCCYFQRISPMTTWEEFCIEETKQFQGCKGDFGDIPYKPRQKLKLFRFTNTHLTILHTTKYQININKYMHVSCAIDPEMHNYSLVREAPTPTKNGIF